MGELAGAVHHEHLDEAPATELGESVRRPHTVVMEGARRQRKAYLFELPGRLIEVANSQYHVIDGTSGSHVRLLWKAAALTESFSMPLIAERGYDPRIS
jgi:hypothetical protein